MPDLYIAQEVVGNTFKIGGGKPDAKVSWQVTGVRQDPYATANPIQPEQEKAAKDKGKYHYPQGYGQPESMGIGYDKTRQVEQQPETLHGH
jgi:hypothetical protein